MRTRKRLMSAASAAALAIAAPAWAAPGGPVKVGYDLEFDPIIEARLRYEGVDQPATDADAVTVRLRAGGELKNENVSLLVEAEGTLGIVNEYNAFSFPIASSQRRPQFSAVGDPMNVELNRLQLQYKAGGAVATLGRQRINIDDQRWIGAAAWRQNEQTFDAVRGEAKIGAVSLDAGYIVSQRTPLGIDAGPRQAFSGDSWFGGVAVKLGPVSVKGFAYALNYDEAVYFANSSVTVGGRVVAPLALGQGVSLGLVGSYARQSDHGRNPVDYSADYLALEAALGWRGLTLTGGWEVLGSDADAAGGLGRAVQTPMATLHKFNGWADMFTTTPAKGLQDFYVTAAYKFEKFKALNGLNTAVTWHRYRSDTGSIDYGEEWDASLGFKLGRYAILAKYANYDAQDFGADTEKLWLQIEVGY